MPLLNVKPPLFQPVINPSHDIQKGDDNAFSDLDASYFIASSASSMKSFIASVIDCLSKALIYVIEKVNSFVRGIFKTTEVQAVVVEEEQTLSIQEKMSTILILSRALGRSVELESLDSDNAISRRYDEIQEYVNTKEGEAALKDVHLLDVGGLCIEFMPKGIFDKFENLQCLDLSENTIRALPKGIFDKLTNLRQLCLYSNALEEIPEGVFDKLTNLEQLNLADNFLKSLPEGLFDKLIDLEHLELAENRLVELPEGIFDNLKHLSGLLIHSSGIKILKSGIFDALESLTKLDITDCYYEELPENIFDRLINLESLTISDSKGDFEQRSALKRLPKGIFDKLEKLEFLKISYTSLKDLPVGIFDRLTNLSTLALDESDLNDEAQAIVYEFQRDNPSCKVFLDQVEQQ